MLNQANTNGPSDDFVLPAHYAVRRYFREQSESFERLTSYLNDEKLPDWSAGYESGRLTPEKLGSFADEFEALLWADGAFSVQRKRVCGTRSFPYRERQFLSGYAMEPIALGQGVFAGTSKPYTEQALFLRSISMEFRLKKARLGVGASGLILTQHMLERTYERTDADHRTFSNTLHKQINELLQGIALAETADLWMNEGPNRVTAVPFANGLLILNNRLLFGNSEEGELGFHYELPQKRCQTPYINAKLSVGEKLGRTSPDWFPILPAFSLTYLNLATLNTDELDYYYAFQGLKNEVGVEALMALAHCWFTPNLAHEKWGGFKVNDHLQIRVQRVRNLLKMGWLKIPEALPFASILPFGSQPPRTSTISTGN